MRCSKLNFLFYFRKRNYLSFQESLKTNWASPSKDSFRHVYLRSMESVKQSMSDFSNTTNLTLTDNFNVNDLQEFFPLPRLTELRLTHLNFPFEQLLKLLQLTPNLHKITFPSTILDQVDEDSIQSEELFQNVSKTNTITTVIIHRTIARCTLPMITTLFSRMRHLSLYLHRESLRPIILQLIPVSHNHIPYLSTLCLSSRQNNLMKPLQTILKSTNILPEYEMRTSGRYLYLWW